MIPGIKRAVVTVAMVVGLAGGVVAMSPQLPTHAAGTPCICLPHPRPCGGYVCPMLNPQPLPPGRKPV
jgi:hypothetical protein